jgi:hypothetical protein
LNQAIADRKVQQTLLNTPTIGPQQQQLFQQQGQAPLKPFTEPEVVYPQLGRNTFLQASAAEAKLAEDCKKSVAGPIVKLDACFNNNSDGVITLATGHGFIAGQWHGTSSVRDVLPNLAAVGLRMKSLGQVSAVQQMNDCFSVSGCCLGAACTSTCNILYFERPHTMGVLHVMSCRRWW